MKAKHAVFSPGLAANGPQLLHSNDNPRAIEMTFCLTMTPSEAEVDRVKADVRISGGLDSEVLMKHCGVLIENSFLS